MTLRGFPRALVRFAQVHPGWTSIVVFVMLVLGLAFGDWSLSSAKWSRTDLLALGQLAVAVLLVPTALYGFLTAAAAFRRTQATPTLSLRWLLESGEIATTLSVTADPTSPHYVQPQPKIAVCNTGEALALWYVIEITIPPWPPDPRFAGAPSWHQLLGERSLYGNGEITQNWQIERRTENTALAEHVRFFSNGQFAVYPNAPVLLGWVAILASPGVAYHNPHPIEYIIYTEHGQPTQGKLQIRVDVVAPEIENHHDQHASTLNRSDTELS